MALILILPLLALAACIVLGCYSWVIAIIGTSFTACLLFSSKMGEELASRLASSLWLSMGCCIGHSLAILIDGDFARVIPAALVVANSVIYGQAGIRECLKFNNLAILPLSYFGFWTIDRDVGSMALAASALYIVRHNKLTDLTSGFNGVVVSVVIACLGAVSYCVNNINKRDGKVGIIQAGEWAKTMDDGVFPDNLNQQLSYSYSGFKSLLNAETIEVEAGPIEEFSELWLITPTKPFSDDSTRKLTDWVANGGHLVVVCDHTDLFGHARVTNKLLERFSVKTSTAALFKPGSTAFVADGLQCCTIPVKTSSTLSGRFATPLWSARQISEREDYSTPNFFGPLSESIDDKYGRRVVGLRKMFGMGILTVHGDSTVFANFCVYQPGVPELIQRLRTVNIREMVWPYLTIGYLLLTLLSRFLPWTGSALCVYSISYLLINIPCSLKSLNWETFVWASGEKEVVMETGDPKSQLSTAYSLIGLSGSIPRWTESVDSSMKEGLFFGNGKVPSGWKAVTLNVSQLKTDSGFQEWNELYSHLGITPVAVVKDDFPEKDLAAGRLFTDDVMGNWWFDRGISHSRMTRFSSWLKWATRKKFEPTSANDSMGMWHSDQLQDYWLILFSGEELPVRLPAIKNPRNGSQLYLGRGLSAEVVIENGQLSILGSASWTEAWSAPFNWVLVPKQK